MCKCTLPKGLVIKPDGVHELASGLFETGQILTNYTVKVLRCKHCGEYELSWCQTAVMEEVPEEKRDKNFLSIQKGELNGKTYYVDYYRCN